MAFKLRFALVLRGPNADGRGVLCSSTVDSLSPRNGPWASADTGPCDLRRRSLPFDTLLKIFFLNSSGCTVA